MWIISSYARRQIKYLYPVKFLVFHIPYFLLILSAMDTLMKEIYDLDHVPGLLSDEQTRTFFAIIPLDTLFG